MQKTFFISEPIIYAPGLETQNDVLLWAENKKQISLKKTSPSLNYTDPLFRRRLSQLSKMTVDVVHSLVEKSKLDLNTKIVFASFRGELEREFKINKSIIEDKMILPASFSLSVFNAPIALATIACKLKGGYSCVFPSYDNFYNGLACGLSPILSGKEDKILFVYADELIPVEYSDFAPADKKPPLAFSVILSNNLQSNLNCVQYSLCEIQKNVYDFVKLHIKKCYNISE